MFATEVNGMARLEEITFDKGMVIIHVYCIICFISFVYITQLSLPHSNLPSYIMSDTIITLCRKQLLLYYFVALLPFLLFFIFLKRLL